MSAGRGRGRGRGGYNGQGRGDGIDRRQREAGRGNHRSGPSRRREDDPERRRFDAITKGDQPFRDPEQDSRFILNYSIDMDDDEILLSLLNNRALGRVTEALENVGDFELLVAFVQRMQRPMMSVGLRKRRTENLLAACVHNDILIDFISEEVNSGSHPEASLESLVWLVRTLATSAQHGDKAR